MRTFPQSLLLQDQVTWLHLAQGVLAKVFSVPGSRVPEQSRGTRRPCLLDSTQQPLLCSREQIELLAFPCIVIPLTVRWRWSLWCGCQFPDTIGMKNLNSNYTQPISDSILLATQGWKIVATNILQMKSMETVRTHTAWVDQSWHICVCRKWEWTPPRGTVTWTLALFFPCSQSICLSYSHSHASRHWFHFKCSVSSDSPVPLPGSLRCGSWQVHD